ncbi:MAG: hrp1 2 [Actinomycetia bacterium]|jgi:CBS domain-containing protein|nr:hrp1 2 [Actinomycetes bacterium]
MGFISTVASFGIGYVAGTVSGRQGIERLSGRVRRSSSSSEGSGDTTSTMDVREIRQVMTTPPDAVRKTASLQEAARLMKTKHIGDVLVEDEQGRLAGILTDRDVAIRATAEGADPKTTKVEDAYTQEVTALAPTDTVHDAVRMMRSQDVRRLPVVEGGKAVGIVSLGDISVETAPGSLLADISTAVPDR